MKRNDGMLLMTNECEVTISHWCRFEISGQKNLHVTIDYIN